MSDIYKKQAETLRSVNHIVTAFNRYIATSDKSLITGISREELEKTLNVHSSMKSDRESGWYRAILRRLDEMDREYQNRRKTRERVVDWVIGFVVGVGILLVGEWVIKNLGWK